MVPGTYAAEDELFGIGAALGELGTGIFELAPMGTAGEDIVAPAQEVDWMRRLSAAIQRPVTFALIQVDPAPDLWRGLMAESLRAVDDGADLWPQVPGRGFGLLSGHFTTYSLLDQIPAYQQLKARGLDRDELVAALRTDEVRAAVESWEPDEESAAAMKKAFETTYVLQLTPMASLQPDLQIIWNPADSLADHNLKRMLEAGLRVTLNSDDPAYFGGYLAQNYQEAALALALTRDDLVTLARNSLLASFVTEDERRPWLEQLEAVAQS